jgi:hypothetical protein
LPCAVRFNDVGGIFAGQRSFDASVLRWAYIFDLTNDWPSQM